MSPVTDKIKAVRKRGDFHIVVLFL